MKKIAVVNRTNLKNYGSVLQVYALCEAINNLGYQAEVVWEKGNLSKNWDIRPKKIIQTFFKLISNPSLFLSIFRTVKAVKQSAINPNKAAKFDEFSNEHFTRHFYSEKELTRIAKTEEYYKYVCGSDQIWSSTTLYVDPLMYLRFAPTEKRVAYAPSLGRDYIPDYNKRIMRKYISDIPYVSVREKVGQRLIKELTGRDVPVVLDPTLLLTKYDWDKLKIPEKRNNYVLCYFLDETSETVLNTIENICENNGKIIINIGCSFSQGNKVDVVNEHIGPGEFLGLVENADMVFTDSYHGMLFSIIYQKGFWSIERNYGEYDQSSRQRNVLSMLHLENRYISDNVAEIAFEGIDYTKVNKALQPQRDYSINFLNNALKS